MRDWRRIGLVALVGGLLAYEIAKAIAWLREWPQIVALITGTDHELYYQAALRIRAGGPVYPPFELAGPFTMIGPFPPNPLPELYPPTALYGLIVPMSYLPAVLWWLIPLAVIVGIVAHHRPSLAGWAVILACLLPVRSWIAIAGGNPLIWVTAAVALGTVWRPAFALVVLKPSIGPLALFGARSRGWWIGMALLGAWSLTMLPLWRDYLTVLGNAQGGGLLYSLDNVPLVSIPLIAKWSRRPLGDLRDHDRSGTPAHDPVDLRAVRVAHDPTAQRPSRPRQGTRRMGMSRPRTGS